MKQILLFGILLAVAGVVPGCVLAHPPTSRQTEVKLRLDAPRAERYTVRVTVSPAADYSFAPDGRVFFTVPPFRAHGDNVYLFGIKIHDGTAEHVRVIEVRRERRVLRKFSLEQVASLPEDDSGYRIVTGLD